MKKLGFGESGILKARKKLDCCISIQNVFLRRNPKIISKFLGTKKIHSILLGAITRERDPPWRN
jgi:hypothetical protein